MLQWTGIPSSTAVDRVVIALRKEMLEGHLIPSTQLREEMLAQRFSVSRSTVREALRVLTMDGLVTRMPNRSVTVHHMTKAEVEDIFAARLVLERASVQAAGSCDESVLEALEDALATYIGEVQTGDVPSCCGSPRRIPREHGTFTSPVVPGSARPSVP